LMLHIDIFRTNFIYDEFAENHVHVGKKLDGEGSRGKWKQMD